jgi:hypothetical protein
MAFSVADRPIFGLAYIVLIVVVAITNIYVKYLNKAKAR